MKNNVRGMVRAVAEGVSPHAALLHENITHSLPRMTESKFGADELERAYGTDFTPSGKVNDFKPIDTGGLRIRNITVHRNVRDKNDISLPHSRQSRIYVTKHSDSQLMNKAFDATFKQGELPPQSLGAMLDPEAKVNHEAGDTITDMMAIRKPENNPHEAYRDQVLPHVFKHLGMTGHGANSQPHAQWHCQAGCGGCPCSPGFIVHKSDHPLATNHDIHVDVD